MLVLTYIAHAALQPLRLAKRDTFTPFALAALLAARAVVHGGTLGALRLRARALRLLFASGVLRLPALHVASHVLTVLATGGVLVTANSFGAQLAVFVAAGVVIFGA